MRSLVVYNPHGTHSSPVIGSGSGGGPVEDILKRLGNVESDVSELKSQVSGVLAIVPHLATKVDVMDVRTAVAELRGELKSGLSELRAEMAAQFGSMRAEMAARETAFLKWIIATVLTSGGLAFTIAKFVH